MSNIDNVAIPWEISYYFSPFIAADNLIQFNLKTYLDGAIRCGATNAYGPEREQCTRGLFWIATAILGYARGPPADLGISRPIRNRSINNQDMSYFRNSCNYRSPQFFEWSILYLSGQSESIVAYTIYTNYIQTSVASISFVYDFIVNTLIVKLFFDTC